jgi:hypothetical protein
VVPAFAVYGMTALLLAVGGVGAASLTGRLLS